MNKLILLLLSILLLLQTSCSGIRIVKKHSEIDPEIKPYVQEFINRSNGKIKHDDIKNLTIGFNYVKEGTIIGTYHPLIRGVEIDIDREWWESHPSYIDRLSLVFHELGHCVLNRSHSEPSISQGVIPYIERIMFKIGVFKKKNRLYDGCPSSLMNPYSIGIFCMSAHYEYYMYELFNE